MRGEGSERNWVELWVWDNDAGGRGGRADIWRRVHLFDLMEN